MREYQTAILGNFLNLSLFFLFLSSLFFWVFISKLKNSIVEIHQIKLNPLQTRLTQNLTGVQAPKDLFQKKIK